jgi:tetratricopeptide (TPR) repeat protein
MSKPKKSPDVKAPQARRRISVPFALPLSVPVGIVLIAASVFLAYLPSLNGGFIWDDHDLITDNNVIRASDGPLRIWCTTEAIDYWPMTNTTFWIEWRLWEMNSAGYHVTNLILHIAETLLIWIILRKLSIPGAFLAAMIFALHPVNVESVAWIAQRKNLMAMLFFLLSILCYLKHLEHARPRLAAKPSAVHHPLPTFSSFILHPSSFHLWYWLSLAAFTLAMLSKGSVAVLPVLLLGIVWWLRPLTWRDLVWSAPFFLIALVFTAVNMWFQAYGLEGAIRIASFTQRLLGAGCVVWFYLYKAFFPIDLSFVYAHWNIEAGNPLWWLPLLSALAVTAVLWRYRKSWSRPLLFAWGFFCVVLVPVMGLTDVYFMRYAMVADHYEHIAIIAAIALASALWDTWHRPAPGWVRHAATAAAIAVLGTLAVLTWQQSRQYRDEFTLYVDTLKKSPDCWMAHINMGKVFLETGRLPDAMDHFRQALSIKSDCFEAYNDLGNGLAKMGRLQEAIEYYRQALSFKPDYPSALSNLGNALNEAGRPEEAIEYCEKALRLEPGFQKAWFNLGNAYLYTDRPRQAIEYYLQALALKPDYPEAHNNLGNALNQTGRPYEAIEHFQTALRLMPDFAEAHLNMGNALYSLGRLPETIDQYRQALVLKPDFAQAHNNLGGALVQAGRPREAIEHFRQAIRLKPQFADAYNNLAMAYAAMHQSSDALAAAGKALELARSQGQTAFARQIENWLNSYSAGQPDPRKKPPAPGGLSKPP